MKRNLYLALVSLTASLALAAADSVEIRDRIQLADGLFRRSLFELAAKEYGALAAIPDVIDRETILFRLGECQRREKHAKEAAAAYSILLKDYPQGIFAGRAKLQLAVMQMDGDEAARRRAIAAFEALGGPDTPEEIRLPALYHCGETLEKLNQNAEALARYEKLLTQYAKTDYGMYATLRAAWLLTRTGKPEDRTRAIGLYLDMAFKSPNAKASEEGFFFAARLALDDKRYEAAANLFQLLRNRYPDSPRVKDSAVPAAWAYYYAGRYKETVETLAPLADIAETPGREDILYILANAESRLEERARAIDTYSRLISDYPKSRYLRPARYEQILAMFRAGRYADVLEAEPKFLYPSEAIADQLYWICAESAMSIQKPDVSIEYCKKLIEKCPDSSFAKDAYYRLGWLNQKKGAWEAASGWFLKLAGRYPADPLAAKALYLSGFCRDKLGQSESALRDWSELLSRFPNDPLVAETLYQKAMQELKLGNLRGAGVTLDERARRFPNDPRGADAAYWRGVIYRKLDEPAEAEKAFRVSLSGHPAKEFERQATLELGMILDKLGRRDEAAAFFQKLVDAPIAEKLGADRLAWLSEFQYGQKNYDAAIAAATTLLSLPEKLADKGWCQTAWTLVGRARLAKGERDPALKAFREAIATGAATRYGTEAALQLGTLLTEGGAYDEAITNLTFAAERAVGPEGAAIRARAYMGLADASEKKGDLQAALRYNMSVSILFDNAEIVPQAFARAASLLDRLGRQDEAAAMREESKRRYPPKEEKKP